MSSDAWEPTSLVAKAWYEAGFLYNPKDNYNYSRLNPQQRKLGYAYAYDEYCLPCNMNLDFEPVLFDYDGKRWLIELWKGQYGIEIGGEIGVYYRDPEKDSDLLEQLDASVGQRPSPDGGTDVHNSLFFLCADDDNLLKMSFTLYKNGQKLFERSDTHWWLTAFRWGDYVEPSELSMKVKITFPNAEMQKAFKNALHAMGYGSEDGYSSSTEKCYVKFTYSTPKSMQPTKDPDVLKAVNKFNKNAVDTYKKYTKDKLGGSDDPNDFPPTAALYALSVARANGGYPYEVLRHYIGDFDAADRVMAALSDASVFDYGCVVHVYNNTEHDIVLKADPKVKEGHWYNDLVPPNEIKKNHSVMFILRDDLGVHGAKASMTYKCNSHNHEVDYLLSFGCPTFFGDNYVKHPNQNTESSFVTSTSGPDDWGKTNHVNAKGHPLYIKYTLKS